MTQLVIDVYGIPAPQGSKRAVAHNKTGRIVLMESSKKVKPWRETVKWAVRDALGAREPFTGPVSVTAVFYLPRPKNHYGTGRNAGTVKESAPRYPATQPDVDKLARSTLDGCGEGGVWRDDAQVTALHVLKRYASRPGARIIIGPDDPAIGADPWHRQEDAW